MKKILLAIGSGSLKGLPFSQTFKKVTSGEKLDTLDWVAIIAELATVGLIAAFVFGKITFDDLLKLIGLLN
jgi:hypothetical protein